MGFYPLISNILHSNFQGTTLTLWFQKKDKVRYRICLSSRVSPLITIQLTEKKLTRSAGLITTDKQFTSDM